MPNKLNEHLPPVAKWMQRTQDQVLDKFYGLANAFSDGEKQERFVYIPGTRDDRVLLVAHADTVWRGQKVHLAFQDDILFSLQRNIQVRRENSKGFHTNLGIGIGADDRAGCFIIWELRDLGHSILITSGEEVGCVATRRIMNSKWWNEELEKHQFAIQFDRKGKKDIVFYDCGTKSFAEYVIKQTGFTPETGTTTDIRHICKKICGVNISVGYCAEHTENERLVHSQLINSLSIAKEWLSKPKIDKFPLDNTNIFRVTSSYQHNDNYNCGYQSHKNSGHTPPSTNNNNITHIVTEKGFVVKTSEQQGSPKDRIHCPNPQCKHNFHMRVWIENKFKCPKCNQTI